MPNYFFDNLNFKNKKEVDIYIRNKKKEIFKKVGLLKNMDCESPYFNFFMEIVNSHHNKEQKIGGGIEYFYFDNDFFNNTQLGIKNKEGFSNISCIYSKITRKLENCKNSFLTDVMRNAIYPQILQYKLMLSKPFFCYNCNSEASKFHIDHIYPFSKIRDDFLISVKNYKIPNKFRKIENTLDFLDEDQNFKDDWIKYHFQNVSLQILCKECNLSKSNKIETI